MQPVDVMRVQMLPDTWLCPCRSSYRGTCRDEQRGNPQRQQASCMRRYGHL